MTTSLQGGGWPELVIRRGPAASARRWVGARRRGGLRGLHHAKISKGLTRHERAMVALARDAGEVRPPSPEPLVTVRIATYNAGDLLRRSIESAVKQSYERLEILVVGDSCDPETERAVRSFSDPRLRFVNLPRRGRYPIEPQDRWCVAGAHPMNAALALAEGEWIAPLDDDDEFTSDHVERLITSAQAQQVEFIFSRALMQLHDASWVLTPRPPIVEGVISHGAVAYSMGLNFMTYTHTSYLAGVPGDWDLWTRMIRAGVRMGFVDAITYAHYSIRDQHQPSPLVERAASKHN